MIRSRTKKLATAKLEGLLVWWRKGEPKRLAVAGRGGGSRASYRGNSKERSCAAHSVPTHSLRL